MQKDIIYIDAEDDITTIIGKIKKSKGTLIALVPPKRVGPIHGAVNLRLIARAASQSKKRVVRWYPNCKEFTVKARACKARCFRC